jgi:MFS family permease
MAIAQLRKGLFEAFRGKIYFGWIILAACTVMFFASGPGQSHTFSIFIQSLNQELGIEQAGIASAYGFATLFAALLLPRLGRFVDRFGSFRMFLAVGTLLGFACIGFGLVSNVYWLGASFASLRFFGQGALMMLCATLVAQWFQQKRGFAMGIMAMGFAASIAVHPALSQWLLDTLGWRDAWLGLGVISWAIILPLTLLFVHNKPEPVGLLPDGKTPEPEEDSGTAQADQSAEQGLTRYEAIRTPTFWVIAFGLFTPAMLITSLFFFQKEVLISQGQPETLAATVFVVTGVMMAASLPVVGWILDRVRTRYVFSGFHILLSATLVMINFVDGLPSALIYGAMFGLCNAFSITFFGYIWAHYFGRKHIGSIQGVGQMIGVFGASLGPLPMGFAYDIFGNYHQILFILALLPISAAALSFFLQPPLSELEENDTSANAS